MPQNMSFGSNGVYQVRSLRKITIQLHLANLGVNGASSASFASTFMQSRKVQNAQNMSFGSNGLDQLRSFRKIRT
jgi:hypothetical protein